MAPEHVERLTAGGREAGLELQAAVSFSNRTQEEPMRSLSVPFCLLVAISLSSCAGQPAGESPGSDAAPQVKGEAVTYSANGDTLIGYLAVDTRSNEPRPGILVVHEWWGQNEYARKRADMLAALGYTAFALDMYGNGKLAEHPGDAMAFSSAVFQNFDTARARFMAALDRLRQEPTVDPTKIAVIGYCFGGGIALNMARQGLDVRGVVSFHGSLQAVSPAEPGGVRAPLLVFNGAADSFVPAEAIDAFKHEMDAAGAEYTFRNLEGAIHSFTNPGADAAGQRFNLPLAYDQAADEQSWAEMQAFFDDVFAR